MRFVLWLGIAIGAWGCSSEVAGAPEIRGCSAAPSVAAGACVELEDLPVLAPLGARRCDGMPVGRTWDPSEPGPFPVGVRTLTLTDPTRPGRRLTTEVWYPADESARAGRGTRYLLLQTPAVWEAPLAPRDATAGLVVFSHGNRGVRYQSVFLTIYLASHGYVVAAPDHQGNTLSDSSAPLEQAAADRVLDMDVVTSAMIARAESADDFFAASFDPRRVAWIGHSFGASTVLMAGALDNREMLDIALAPAFDERMPMVYAPPSYDLRAALVVVGGARDQTVPFEHQQLAFARSAAPRHLLELGEAGHFDFTDLCDALGSVEEIARECSPTPEARSAAHATIDSVVTAALDRYVRCDPSAEAWLDPAMATTLGALDTIESNFAEVSPSVTPAPVPAVCSQSGPASSPAAVVERVELRLPRADAPTLYVGARRSATVSAGAPAVLFVHGLATSGAVFDRTLDALGSRWRVGAVDLRGHGRSDADPHAPFGVDETPGTDDDPYSVERFADDVLVGAGALAPEGAPVVLVGWSSGGRAALLAALRSPERVRALVLVDAAPLARADFVAHPDYNGGEPLDFARLVHMAAIPTDTRATTWRPIVERFFAPAAPCALVDEVLATVLDARDDTLRGELLARPADPIDRLEEVSVPTLVIHGEQDEAVLLESGRYLASRIPRAELVVLQQSGHAPFLEEPGHFERELERFVDALTP